MGQYGLTPKGPNIKRLDIILDEMHSDLSKKLGVNTKQNPQSLLNHLLTNIGDQIAELWELGLDVYYAMYPSTAEGIDLDNAAQFGGSTRELATPSYYHILCTGIDGTVIPNGTLIASDTNPATQLTINENQVISRGAFNKVAIKTTIPEISSTLTVVLNSKPYSYTPKGKVAANVALQGLVEAVKDEDFLVVFDAKNTIMRIEAVDPVSVNAMILSESLTTETVGSVITFATVEDGDIRVMNGAITKIVKAVPGMMSVINVGDYIAGQFAETDMEFRRSYVNKIFNRSSSMLESVKSAILENVQGVISVAPYENATDEVDEMGRWPHSIEVVVDGGDSTEIAKQILQKKAGGINTYGSIEVSLRGIYGEEIVIRFNRPTYVNVWFKVGVTLSQGSNPPINYVDLIKEQILGSVGKLEAGESVVPQKFNLSVPGIDYMDVWVAATKGGEGKPSEYPHRSISVTARERAVTEGYRIEVVIDG